VKEKTRFIALLVVAVVLGTSSTAIASVGSASSRVANHTSHGQAGVRLLGK